MEKNKINNLELGSIIYFISRAFLLSVTFNAVIKYTKQDSWYIPILNIIPGIIFIFFLISLMNYEPNLPLTEKLKKLFNNKISNIMLISSVLFASFLGIVNYLNLGNFIQSQFLSNTPILAISIMFSIATYYVLSKGINAITRASTIFLYINIVLFLLSFISLIPQFRISNLMPFFNSSVKDNFNSLLNFYAFNITPIFMISIIPKSSIKNPKLKKTLLISFIFSAITLFIMIFSTISTFGYELSILYEYPEFHVLKNISIGGLSSRIESILVIQLLFDVFISHVIIIYFIANIIASIFKIKKMNLLYFIIITIFVIGVSLFSRFNIYIDNILINGIPLISSIFTIILDSIIFIKIKTSKKLVN
ncbi:MAG: endospore germination permease [bacterium]|nr:endospore germination permease [bacterium]